MRRPPVVAPAVVAALVALVGTGTVVRSSGPVAAGAVSVPVVGGGVLCPAVRNEPGTVTTVGVGTTPGGAPVAPDTGELSTVTAAPLAADGTPAPLPLDARGRVTTGLAADVADDAVVVRARGALAAGLGAEQLTRATAPTRRGWASLACSPARTDAWWAGGSLGVGESTALVLVNPDATPASVDVQLWSAEGPVDARPGRGLLLPARSRRVLGLDTLAPGRTGLAVHVVAARGRFAAALEHTRSDAGTPQGTEDVPASPRPAQAVEVTALPAGPGERALLVTNPGTAPAVAQVQLTRTDGQFVPTGLTSVAVAAGTTVRVDLTELLAPGAAAATVTSSVPVLAVGLAVDGDGPVHDLAYAGAAPALTGTALVPDGQGGRSALLLSALLQDAAVELVALPVAGTSGPLPPARTVQVPGGSTVVVPFADLGAVPGGRLAVAVRPLPGSGPVHAARLLRDDLPDGPLTTLLPLVAPVEQSTRPVVGRDPGASLPGG